MTTSVKISVNGNYKVPVRWKQGDHEEQMVVSGRGREGPNEQTIWFQHGNDAMMLEIGPETYDDSTEAGGSHHGGVGEAQDQQEDDGA